MSHLEQEQLLFTPTAPNFGSNFIRLADIILQGLKFLQLFIPKWEKVDLTIQNCNFCVHCFKSAVFTTHPYHFILLHW